MIDNEKDIDQSFDIEENFSIPDNYFDDFEARLSAKIAEIESEEVVESTPLFSEKKKKIIPITWISTSVAAAAIGLLCGIFVFNHNNTDNTVNNDHIQANTTINSDTYYNEIVDYYDAIQIEEYLALSEFPTLE
ncbi:MAG: hypothetical protein MSH47_07925 [Bacteroidales bacterium]|nr:hypothetical protein [Bacteroidales bacterium]MDY5194197.1 hypothetical protein [Candidatus Aphodosoma sp.]